MAVQVLFWLAAATIVYTFLGYPVLIGLLARWRPRPVALGGDQPTLTLLIPAYNEAAVIVDKLRNSLEQDYPRDRLQVVVVADGSTDGTDRLVAEHAAAGVQLYHQPPREGKAAAVNRVMPDLRSEVVAFTDANAMLAPGALASLVRPFADPRVAGVSGEKRVTGGGEGLYWRYESYLKRCDATVSSVMGAAGELFAVRRALYQPVEPDSIIEDFVMSLRLVQAGWRVAYAPDAVALEEPPSSLAAEWQRRTRIAAGGFQSIRRLTGLLNPFPGRWLITWQYVSHRVLRWAVTPLLLPVVYLLNLALIAQPLYLALWLGQTLFYGVGGAGFLLARRGRRRGVLYAVFFFCFTNAAALAGLWRYLTGRQPVTWTKVR